MCLLLFSLAVTKYLSKSSLRKCLFYFQVWGERKSIVKGRKRRIISSGPSCGKRAYGNGDTAFRVRKQKEMLARSSLSHPAPLSVQDHPTPLWCCCIHPGCLPSVETSSQTSGGVSMEILNLSSWQWWLTVTSCQRYFKQCLALAIQTPHSSGTYLLVLSRQFFTLGLQNSLWLGTGIPLLWMISNSSTLIPHKLCMCSLNPSTTRNWTWLCMLIILALWR